MLLEIVMGCEYIIQKDRLFIDTMMVLYGGKKSHFYVANSILSTEVGWYNSFLLYMGTKVEGDICVGL